MKYLDNEATIKMVQKTQSRWEIQTRKGFVLKSDITVSNIHDAEIYVKNYLTSFNCWSYEVVPMEKDKK